MEKLGIRFLSALWLMTFGWACFGHRVSYAATEESSQPNIIIIYADDMGLGDLGCYGGTLAATPRIDELARDGIRFTQYYSSSPICSPSRAGLITGIFPGKLAITRSHFKTASSRR
jgi:hypothetical protein